MKDKGLERRFFCAKPERAEVESLDDLMNRNLQWGGFFPVPTSPSPSVNHRVQVMPKHKIQNVSVI